MTPAADMYNDGRYLNAHPDWDAADAPVKAGYLLRLLHRQRVEVKTVAEVGCGSGEILVQLDKAIPGLTRLTGYEISADALQLARRRATDRIRFELRDWEKDPPGEGSDLILVMDVLEHVENYFALLRSLRGRSRFIAFHIPLDLSVLTLWREGKLIDARRRIGHIHVFTEKFILSLLEEYGFLLLDHCYTSPSFEHKTLRERFVNSLRRLLYFFHPRTASRLLGGYSLMILAAND
jgi:SAM-dependent methyltransferase